MDGDRIAEDRSESTVGSRLECVREEPTEDTEAAIGGVDDGGTRLCGRDIGERHQGVVPDYSPSWTAIVDSNPPAASAAIKYRGR